MQCLSDRFAAAAVAEKLAARAGLPSPRARAAAVVAAELAENVVRHGGGGEVEIAICAEARLLRISASDSGPPFRDLEMALCDGSTDSRPLLPEELHGRTGFGAGLGALRRLSQGLIVNEGPAGKVLVSFVSGDSEASGERFELLVRRFD